LTSILLSEINDAFPANLIRYNKSLGKNSSEVEVTAMGFFSAILHQTATRIMIGPELSSNSEFLSASTSLLSSIFFTALIIVKLPLGPLRDLLAYPLTLPHKWKLQRCFKMLRPIVAERVQRRRLLQAKEGNEDEKTDAIEWTLDLALSPPDAHYDSVDFITEELLHNLWAASSAPGGLMTQIVFSLLHEPKYIAPIREEAEKAVAQYGWGEKLLGNLPFQDSFIREVNRLFPTGSGTYA
jgi:cytochrome P450